jgi:hypothetical protein
VQPVAAAPSSEGATPALFALALAARGRNLRETANAVVAGAPVEILMARSTVAESAWTPAGADDAAGYALEGAAPRRGGGGGARGSPSPSPPPKPGARPPRGAGAAPSSSSFSSGNALTLRRDHEAIFRFSSTAGRALVAAQELKKVQRASLARSLGASIEIFPRAVTLPPFGHVAISIAALGDMPGR